ncbi:MAG: 50S ribosomal protein L15 [Candidatus Sumerlaeota bacterium]
MKLEQLPGDKGARQTSKRVGRGEASGWGKTSGRGHKGAQSRSGTTKGKGFEGGQTPLMRRLPKFGFSRARFALSRESLNLSSLAVFGESATVDMDALREKKLVSGQCEYVKILGMGDAPKNLTITAHGFSASAKEKIEAAGGTCEVMEPRQMRAKFEKKERSEG